MMIRAVLLVAVAARGSAGGESRPTFLRGTTNEYLAIDLDAATTIDDVKHQIYELEEIPLDEQRLVYAGKDRLLAGDERLAELGGGSYDVTVNPHGWHEAANVLFVDQPFGTGLSSGCRTSRAPDRCRDDDDISSAMHAFLLTFFDLHADKFVKPDGATVDFFMAGESHAGHYVPHLAKYVLDRNGEAQNRVISLAGLAIGNGWTEPRYQYAATEVAHGLGLVPPRRRRGRE